MEKKNLFGIIKSELPKIAMIVLCTGVLNSTPVFRQTTSLFIKTFAIISATMCLIISVESLIGSYANEHITSKYQERMRNLIICSLSHLAYFIILNYLCDHLVGFINIPINNIFIKFGLFCVLIYDFANDFSTRFLLIMSPFNLNCEKELMKETENTECVKEIQSGLHYILEVSQRKAYK